MKIQSPVENTAKLEDGKWLQIKPRISQGFGENAQIYKQFGIDGHNGIDIACSEGVPLFAPCTGNIKIIADQYPGKKIGYGNYVKIRSEEQGIEVVLAHLSVFNSKLKDGQHINQHDFIGFSGNTGFSTGPHLHIGVRKLIYNKNTNIFNWTIANYKNGYYGYIDFEIIFWKGTQKKKSFADEVKGVPNNEIYRENEEYIKQMEENERRIQEMKNRKK